MKGEENNKKYLGIDWGEKRIGLALADSELKLATPFKTVSNLKEVVEIVKNEKIDIIVIGKPFQISDYQLPISKHFENFLRLLKKGVKVPIELMDERLTSKAADALGRSKAGAARDAVAAMIILQNYLDQS